MHDTLWAATHLHMTFNPVHDAGGQAEHMCCNSVIKFAKACVVMLS